MPAGAMRRGGVVAGGCRRESQTTGLLNDLWRGQGPAASGQRAKMAQHARRGLVRRVAVMIPQLTKALMWKTT